MSVMVIALSSWQCIRAIDAMFNSTPDLVTNASTQAIRPVIPVMYDVTDRFIPSDVFPNMHTF